MKHIIVDGEIFLLKKPVLKTVDKFGECVISGFCHIDKDEAIKVYVDELKALYNDYKRLSDDFNHYRWIDDNGEMVYHEQAKEIQKTIDDILNKKSELLAKIKELRGENKKCLKIM